MKFPNLTAAAAAAAADQQQPPGVLLQQQPPHSTIKHVLDTLVTSYGSMQVGLLMVLATTMHAPVTLSSWGGITAKTHIERQIAHKQAAWCNERACWYHTSLAVTPGQPFPASIVC
jgi:hypothetical protein